MKRAELLESLDIGSIVKKLREEKGMSQEHLAKGICDRTNITKLENGHYKVPSLSFVLLICDKLEIELNDFLNLALKDLSKLDYYYIFNQLLMNESEDIDEYLKTINVEQLSSKDRRLFSYLKGYLHIKNNENDEAIKELKNAIINNNTSDIFTLLSLDLLSTRNLININKDVLDKAILNLNIRESNELLYLYNRRLNYHLSIDSKLTKIYLAKEIEYINLTRSYYNMPLYYRNKIRVLEKENKDVKDVQNKLNAITQKI